ncbi:MAG: ABC transporter permease [Halarsenatibacteraceae bacterium]
MKYLFKIAFRNLSRNKVRSFISILAIAIVVMIVVFARGLILGTMQSTLQLQFDNQLGHVRILAEEYETREALLSLEYTVDGLDGQGLEPMLADLAEIEGVEHLLPRLKFGAMASPGDDLITMAGIGVDPESESEYGGLTADIVAGRMIESGDEIVVGKGLLNKFKAEVGSRVTILFSDAYQSFQGRTFTIVGVRDTGLNMLDERMFFLPLATAQDMLYLGDEATEVLVFGRDFQESKSIAGRIDNYFTDSGETNYLAQPWQQGNEFMEYFQVAVRIYDVIYVFFILLGSIVLINTMIMIVRERTSEIGMMGALGLKKREIMQVFAMEGAVMGTLGSFIGVIPGGILTYYLSQVGLDYYSHLLEDMDIILTPVIYPVFSLENLVISFLLGAIVSSLTALWPARNAAKMEPVDALHREI